VTQGRSVHPFPARMAPELAVEALEGLPAGTRILDPLCGSGTVLRRAAEQGLPSLGTDIDPLAVKMARVWSTVLEAHAVLHDAEQVLRRARCALKRNDDVSLPWQDAETVRYIRYWFGDSQRRQLHYLAAELAKFCGRTKTALEVALSRTIITKDRGASLARDVSHSRPHRVSLDSDFDVFSAFSRSVLQLTKRLRPDLIRKSANVELGDFRELGGIADQSVDCVITSPPYLNAIDYMRGHRLALVWLGYSVKETTAIRASAVGAERAVPEGVADPCRYVTAGLPGLQKRHLGWIRRYQQDAGAGIAQCSRVLPSKGGLIVIVVGNSTIRGTRVDNAGIYADWLTHYGFSVRARTRLIPSGNRYLPPPSGGTGLQARMREEVVLVGAR